jgi:putative phage-type endonuclease
MDSIIHKNVYDYFQSNNIFDIILLNINNKSIINSTKKNTIRELIQCYSIIHENNNSDIFKSIEYYIYQYVDWIINDYVLKNKIYIIRKNKVSKLRQLKLPEQRSIDWFNMRKSVLTASSFAAALGKCHYTSRDQLILDKASTVERPYESNPITEWGVKYEEIATKFYEHLKKVKIIEFGMIPHPKFPIFGASPDGICSEDSPPELIGRMLEIKCPPKRKFTKSVPQNYMYQMQGQLECCDLDECDFLQVKLEEYSDFDEYVKDTNSESGQTKNGLPKGCVVTYRDLFSEKNLYLYPELYKSDQYYIDWDANQKKWIQENKKEYYETKWFCITRYECTLVERNRNFWNDAMPEIIRFWEDVEYYKRHGTESLEKIVESKRYKKPVTFINTKECMID